MSSTSAQCAPCDIHTSDSTSRFCLVLHLNRRTGQRKATTDFSPTVIGQLWQRSARAQAAADRIVVDLVVMKGHSCGVRRPVATHIRKVSQEC
mmetsp:Transcript_26662/g.80047  ORF Transcript_26662/g.80047 Transcript_26662/m.80047 type:complete len:93 (+) Transcript_26662:2-280(+)